MRAGNTTLRGRLTRNLVGIGLLSVLLLAVINLVAARSLLDNAIDGQLISLRNARTEALEGGFGRIEQEVSLLARDPSVAGALIELSTGYDSIDQDITPEQVADLERLYEDEALSTYDEAGVDRPDAAELVPASVAGRYVQQHYIAGNPLPPEDRGSLDDAGDGSPYSQAHARHSPFLRQLAADAGVSDLLLVGAENGDVVYSSQKRIDFGTDALEGPYEAGLRTVLEGLSAEAAGDAVAADTVYYMPDASSPVIFLAAAVRDGSRVVGALIVELPSELITDLTTAGQEWDLLGLGDTGETYVVGRDETLRSDSRLWLEDPDEYLRRLDTQDYEPRVKSLTEAVGSPVLIQPVENEAVATALDGEDYIGSVSNYLGDETRTASAPVDVAGLDWVVVAEQARSEADDALGSFIGRILLLLAVLLPAIAIVGALLARALVRPISPLVAAAGQMAEGDLDVEIEDLGRNEFGDLGRQLEAVGVTLREHRESIGREEERINEMLRTVLPARLVQRVRDGERQIADMLDTATVISLTIDGLPDPTGTDADTYAEVSERYALELDRLVDDHKIDRARASADSQLFLAGLGRPDADCDNAAQFALALVRVITSLAADSNVELRPRVGLSSGEVATGVLGMDQISFGVWGNPTGTALTLDSVARPGEILVDRRVAEALGAKWSCVPTDLAVGLDEDAIEAFTLVAEGDQVGEVQGTRAQSDGTSEPPSTL